MVDDARPPCAVVGRLKDAEPRGRRGDQLARRV